MTASTASTPARRSRCCTPGGSSSANVLQPRRRRRRCCRSKVALAAGALLALVCLATAAAGSGGGSSSSSSGGAAAGRGGTAWPTETTAAAAATERAEDDSSGASSSSSGGGGGFTTGAKPRHTPQDAARDAALWRWLEAGGAVVHFAPGYSPGGVRGGFATRDIPAGGVVASIPWRLAYKFPRRWKSFVVRRLRVCACAGGEGEHAGVAACGSARPTSRTIIFTRDTHTHRRYAPALSRNGRRSASASRSRRPTARRFTAPTSSRCRRSPTPATRSAGRAYPMSTSRCCAAPRRSRSAPSPCRPRRCGSGRGAGCGWRARA